MLKDEELERVILGSNIRSVETVDSNEDMYKICAEVPADKNVFKFTNQSRIHLGRDSWLGVLGDKPKDVFELIKSFRYHWNVGRGALGGSLREDYISISGDMIGYQSGLEYRKAGIGDPLMGGEKKHSLLDKLKKG